MSMMQMLMASHISESLGPVPPLPTEEDCWAHREGGTGIGGAQRGQGGADHNGWLGAGVHFLD